MTRTNKIMAFTI